MTLYTYTYYTERVCERKRVSGEIENIYGPTYICGIEKNALIENVQVNSSLYKQYDLFNRGNINYWM